MEAAAVEARAAAKARPTADVGVAARAPVELATEEAVAAGGMVVAGETGTEGWAAASREVQMVAASQGSVAVMVPAAWERGGAGSMAGGTAEAARVAAEAKAAAMGEARWAAAARAREGVAMAAAGVRVEAAAQMAATAIEAAAKVARVGRAKTMVEAATVRVDVATAAAEVRGWR